MLSVQSEAISSRNILDSSFWFLLKPQQLFCLASHPIICRNTQQHNFLWLLDSFPKLNGYNIFFLSLSPCPSPPLSLFTRKCRGIKGHRPSDLWAGKRHSPLLFFRKHCEAPTMLREREKERERGREGERERGRKTQTMQFASVGHWPGIDLEI